MTDTHAAEKVGFATLVLSLVNNAAILLGDVPDPTTGKAGTPDLEAASYMIDLLGMLEKKTRGNLTADEERLLQQALYDLRLRYVAVRDQKAPKDEPRIIIP
jgi:hypothetical protein